ncbi:unnamed protein product [Symbiodinium natans]|uniref:Uncharacterized protein n=1 Tax=Symbiodinium natans TaxID=878477 RepID=A0A812G976_9DINO|nr:unnamed protein product [Symbiodinium natans]
MYSVGDTGWQLNANLTALAAQNGTERWVQADLSTSNIAIFFQAREELPLNVYSFAYDGTSWAFLNLETFPEGAQCSAKFGGCLKLGGNLMVFRAATDGTSRPFQTFQWQGAGWSLVPGANLTVTSQSTARL